MTMALAMRCRDGLLLVTDGKVGRASTSFRTVARIWQRTNKVHRVAPHVLVAGAGELAMIHEVVAAMDALPEEVRARGVDGVLPAARAALAQARAEAIARYAAIHGPEGRDLAPKAHFLLVQADPAPRIVFLSEDADVEDQTHLRYAAIGAGDLIVHVRMQPYDPSELSVEQGAVLAYGLVKDVIDSGTFRVSDPVQVWSVRPGAAPSEWDDATLAKTEERYHAFRRKVHDALREV